MVMKMGFVWHLRHRMVLENLTHTSDLVPRLAERGVVLSREQVYRLVAHPPRRLSMTVLAALCDILDCTPSDIIEPVAVADVAGSKGDEHQDTRVGGVLRTADLGAVVPGSRTGEAGGM